MQSVTLPVHRVVPSDCHFYTRRTRCRTQLYVKGELVGGCDIVIEMSKSGELEALLRDKMGPDFAAASAAAMAAAPGEDEALVKLFYHSSV